MTTTTHLFASCRGLALSIARRYARRVTGVPVEDLEAAALVGLWYAETRFDPSRKVKFSTYAAHCIRREVIDWFRDTRQTRRRLGYTVLASEVETHDVDRNHPGLLDLLTARQPTRESEEAARLVEIGLRVLSPRARQVVWLYWWERRDMREIAPVIGCGPANVSLILQSAYQRMRERIEQELRREES